MFNLLHSVTDEEQHEKHSLITMDYLGINAVVSRKEATHIVITNEITELI